MGYTNGQSIGLKKNMYIDMYTSKRSIHNGYIDVGTSFLTPTTAPRKDTRVVLQRKVGTTWVDVRGHSGYLERLSPMYRLFKGIDSSKPLRVRFMIREWYGNNPTQYASYYVPV